MQSLPSVNLKLFKSIVLMRSQRFMRRQGFMKSQRFPTNRMTACKFLCINCLLHNMLIKKTSLTLLLVQPLPANRK